MEPLRSSEVDQLLFELTQPTGRADPYPYYAALRRTAPLALAEDGAIVLTRYADCHAVLHHPRFGRAEPDELFESIGLPDWKQFPALWTLNTSMLSVNPPQHTRLRRLVSKAFTARKVEQLRGWVADTVDTLLDQLDGGGDFVDTVAFPLPVAVIGELLGVPEADRAAFQPLVRDWTMVLDVFTLDVLARERRRRADPQLSRRPRAAASAQAAGRPHRLSEDELVTMAALLFAAGFETTTHLLGNGLVALLANPDQAAALRKDADLAPAAVEELLRFDSSVQLAGRTALADTEVAGVPIAKGDRLVCYTGAANRDPERFDEPDRLDLTRREGAPLSFGGGIHYCLGAPLARLEAQLTFPALLTRYPDLQLADGAQRRDSLTLRGYLHLPVNC